MIDIKDVHCVLAVAEEKSITKAAEKLFLTQSAVSQKITRAEKSLGLTLFARTNRSVELTEAGEFFVKRAKKMTDEWASFLRDMENFSQKEQKTINVGMSSLAAYSEIPAICSAFMRKYPNYQFNMLTSSFEDFPQTFKKDSLDFLFIYTSVSDAFFSPELSAHQLGTDCIYVLLHKNDPLSYKESIMMKDLYRYHLLFDGPHLIKAFPEDLQLRFSLCKDSLLPSMISDSGFFTLTPKSRCQKILERYPHLCAVPFDDTQGALTVYLVYRSSMTDVENHPFYQFVTKWFKEHQTSDS